MNIYISKKKIINVIPFDFATPLDVLGFKLNNGIIFKAISNRGKIHSIPLGNVNLTKTGMALYKSIGGLCLDDLLDFISLYMKKRNFIISTD